MKAIIPAILACLLLCGCSEKLRSGRVCDKEYRSAKTVMIMMPMVVSRGGTTSTTLMPMWFFYPERWAVRIEQKSAGRSVQATWWVDRETYHRTAIGDWFSANGNHSTAEPREKTDGPDE